MELRFPQSVLIPDLLGLPVQVFDADMNVHFRRCQMLVTDPLLNHCGVAAPSVQRVADMRVAERMH